MTKQSHLIPSVDDIITFHENTIIRWKSGSVTSQAQDTWLAKVEANHKFNYLLWNEEDKARRKDKGSDFVCDAKRAIDGYNQKRNDAMEAIDDYLVNQLVPSHEKSCPVHSETPGMIIDRLSILSLKQYHMNLQTVREDVSEEHRLSCSKKLSIITAQKIQLSECLKRLLHEFYDNTRTFRVYRQMKMYNSATLNPQLYAPQEQETQE